MHLNGIKSAAVPDKVSQDFVKTILGIKGGSGDQVTSLLKKLGMANPDGSPSDIYKKFRNPTSSGRAIASAIRQAYAPLYVRNEYMHKLNDAALTGLVVEETGQAHDSGAVKLVVSCIKHLKTFADFDATADDERPVIEPASETTQPSPSQRAVAPEHKAHERIGLNLGYTINLNLPATSDSAVFDAIFRSLKEHLLRDDDG